MGLVVVEARGTDFFEALDESGGVVTWRHRRHFGLLCRQVADGAAITARDARDGRLVCIAGLYGLPDGAAEAWFSPGPAFRANRVTAMRGLRRVFELLGREAAPLRVIAYVRPAKAGESVAGARLARWLGFADAGPDHWAPGVPVRRFERRF